MYGVRKRSEKKEKAYAFYNSFKGNKVCRPTFYQRVRLGGDETWEEKITPKLIQKDRRKTPRGRRAKEIERYNEQPEPKASKTLFRNRLVWGYPKEQAALMGDEWLAIKREKKIVHPTVQKTYIPKPKVVKPIDERDFRIEITYPKEVAQVFRKEYAKIIEQLEWDLTFIEEKTQVKELSSKLEQLKKERDIFNSYNPR